MSLSAVEREILRSALPDAGPAELFAIDNRDTLDALRAAATVFIRRRGDVQGRRPPVTDTQLHGDAQQIVVLRDLAQEMGFEVSELRDALFVHAPGRSYGVTVAIDGRLDWQFNTEVGVL